MNQHGQDESQDETWDEEDGTLGLMREAGTPVTRENYLRLAYMGQLPVWSAEHEAKLPAQLQEPDPGKWAALNAPAQSAAPSEMAVRHQDVKAAYPQVTDEFLADLENWT